MRRWIGLLALLTLGSPAWAADSEPKDPQVLDKAQKLPVDLPSVLVRGEDETAGPLLPGNKLNPDEPGAVPFSLPRPMTALDLDRYLAEASQSVLPPISTLREALAPGVDGFQEVRVGTGGFHRYDLNGYAARRFTQLPAWAGSEAIGRAEIDGRWGNSWDRAPGDWSRLGLRLSGGTEPSEQGSRVEGALSLNHQATALGKAAPDSFAQLAALRASYDRQPYAIRAGVQAARVGNPGPDQADAQGLDVSLQGQWHPELDLADHWPELDATVGSQLTDKRSDALVLVSVRDTWSIRPEWSLKGGVGLGSTSGELSMLPELSLRYRPSQVTEFSAGVRSQTWRPGLDEQYLSRRYVAGNGALVDQRVPVRVDLAGSQRLSDRWHLRLDGSYLLASRWIAWQKAGQSDGLWRLYNPGCSGDAGSPDQRAFLGGLTAQYQLGSQALQSFFYKIRSVDPLGELVQEAGASHQSEWLRGKLKLELGLSVQLMQLGAGQVGSTEGAAGMQALLQAATSYQLSERVFAFVRADALPLLQTQPAKNYFAPDALVVGGIGIGF